MNEATHGKFNANKCHVLEMGKNVMRSTWTYKCKLGQTIISIVKEEKNLGVVIQDNLSPEKHRDRIFGGTFMMLRNIRMVFHFPDKDMMILLRTAPR